MWVYNRAMGSSNWASVEDYLPAGNALGYNQNWHYRHTGGEWLMRGATRTHYPQSTDHFTASATSSRTGSGSSSISFVAMNDSRV
ncbi:MAG: hypothetical protein KatS3mg020_0112 [Fimbriimonadales bacterium]|nr:MAG: hypothetical protein KatS3mg020_0112 [Fimbriimonadales bacterium]